MNEQNLWESYRVCIREAARHWFDEARQRHRNETIYGYALYSDDSAIGICQATNSEEALARKIAALKIASADVMASYRWSTSEWVYENETCGYPPLDQFDVNALQLLEATYSSPQENELRFERKVFRTMIAALSDLDSEGYFGVGEQRKSVVVIVTITDSYSATEVEAVSVYKLNPTEVVARYLDGLARINWLSDS